MVQLIALFISIAVEAPCSALLLHLMGKPFYGRGALVAAAATLLSHPVAWATHTTWLNHLVFKERALIIEAGVILFEALCYRWLLPLKAWQAFLVSLLANLASFGFGLLITRAI